MGPLKPLLKTDLYRTALLLKGRTSLKIQFEMCRPRGVVRKKIKVPVYSNPNRINTNFNNYNYPNISSVQHNSFSPYQGIYKAKLFFIL